MKRQLELYIEENIGTTFSNNIVSNGTFDDTSYWSTDSACLITGGEAEFTNANANSLIGNVSVDTQEVTISFDVTTYSSGKLKIYAGGVHTAANLDVPFVEAEGSYEFTLNMNGTDGRIIFGSINNATLNIDNVVVRNVLRDTKVYTRADLFDFEEVNYTTRIKDVKDIGKVLTDYSKTFTLPATNINNRLFSHYQNYDVIGQFDARFKRAAIIKLNGVDFREGSISLQKANLQKGNVYSYDITFFGKTVSIKDLFSDDKLESLTGNDTYLDDFDHDLDGSYVSVGFSDGYNYDESTGTLSRDFSGSTFDYCFPFISADDYHYYDSADGISPARDSNLSRNIHPSATYNASINQYTGVRAFAMKPAIRIKWIIKSIEQKYGITFSDDWFNDTNEVYHDCFMWLNREKGRIDEQVGISRFEFQLDDWTYSTGANNFVVNENMLHPRITTGNPLTIGDTNVYFYKTSFTITPTNASGVWGYKVYNSLNNDLKEEHFNLVGAQTIEYTWSGNDFVRPLFVLETGGSVSDASVSDLTITETIRDGDVFTSDTTSSATYTSNYTGIPQITLSEGLKVSANLPKMGVMEFLSSLFKLWNLTAYYDADTEEIVVQTLDDYYANGKYYDISEYVDYDKINVGKTSLFNKIDLTFEGYKTFGLVAANNITGDEFGNERVDHNSEAVSSPLAFDGNQKYEIKLPYEKMMYERMTDQADETVITDIQWGWMANEDQSPIKGKPLLFYPNRITSGTQIRFSQVDGGASVLKTTYIVPSNILDLTDNDSQTLNWGSEYNEYSGDTANTSLFESYYKNYIQRIYHEQSRLITINCVLPTSLLLVLKPNDKFVINHRNFRINTFDTSLTTGQTKLELINEVQIDDPVVIEVEETVVDDGNTETGTGGTGNPDGTIVIGDGGSTGGTGGGGTGGTNPDGTFNKL